MTMHLSDYPATRPLTAEALARYLPDRAQASSLFDAPTSFAPHFGLYRRFFKRALDVTAVLISAPIVVPVVATMALIVRLDGGPAFYTQKRIGMGGRSFRMWKLRSMVRDADARMAGYLAANPEAKAEWDATQKLKADPRITALDASCAAPPWTSCRNSGTS